MFGPFFALAAWNPRIVFSGWTLANALPTGPRKKCALSRSHNPTSVRPAKHFGINSRMDGQLQHMKKT